MTDEEFDEVLHTAMTVGATRMQVMLSHEITQLGPNEAATSTAAPTAAPTAAGDPRPDPAAYDRGAPAFAAAEVVEQAGGG